MRFLALAAILAAIIGCVCSPVSSAQETRPLTVWVDSVRMNVCGPKTFQTAIRVASFRPGDTIIGFRSNDNVASATLYVTWDPSVLRLNSLVVTSGTMSNGIDVTARVIAEESTLEIVIADRQSPYGTIRGALPLVYINGTVIAPDTVAPPNGWIQVTDVELTSDTRFGDETKRPGYVRVERDTSQAFTGSLRMSTGAFDTLELDTLTIGMENVLHRRVNEVSFSIAADTSFFAFVDTLQTGTLAAQSIWTSKSLDITADTIRGRFVATSELSQEGPLLKVRIRRKTDSGFAANVRVANAAINRNSCLGRFLSFGAPVTASAIVRDTSTTAVPVRFGHGDEITLVAADDGRTIIVRSNGRHIDEGSVYDAIGRRITTTTASGTENEIRLEVDAHAAGPYYVQLRIGRERISKQFIFIK